MQFALSIVCILYCNFNLLLPGYRVVLSVLVKTELKSRCRRITIYCLRLSPLPLRARRRQYYKTGI